MGEEAGGLGKLEKKIAVAAALMLTSGHKLPGVRGWELRRRIGRNYREIVEALNSRLRDIGLSVKVVFDSQEEEGDMDRARFYIVLSDQLSLSDLPSIGYRMDELAILAASLAYLFARGERAAYKEVLEVLEAKYPKWRIESVIEKLARRGYLVKTEDGLLTVGWRARVEVDKRGLLRAFMEMGPAQPTNGKGSEGSSSRPQ